MPKKLSEEEIEKIKEYIFGQQKKYFKRIKIRKKSNGYSLRRESNKMLYKNFVLYK